MNKQQEIKELKEDVKDMKNTLHHMETKLENLETEKPIKPGYGWLKKGVKYWFINDCGAIDFREWHGNPHAIYRLNHNNVFQTEEEAQRFLYIETKIYEIQNKNPVDWEWCDQRKYFPMYNIYDKELIGYWHCGEKIGSNKHYSSDLDFTREIKQYLSSDDIDFYFRKV